MCSALRHKEQHENVVQWLHTGPFQTNICQIFFHITLHRYRLHSKNIRGSLLAKKFKLHRRLLSLASFFLVKLGASISFCSLRPIKPMEYNTNQLLAHYPSKSLQNIIPRVEGCCRLPFLGDSVVDFLGPRSIGVSSVVRVRYVTKIWTTSLVYCVNQ